MTWGKVDDKLAFHVKTMKAGNTAMGLWVRALSWCSDQLTDGLVPADMIAVFGAAQEDADRLVSARLWHETIDGYVFHDWAEYQFTRAQVESKRDEAAERMRKLRSGDKSEVKPANVRANTERTSREVQRPHTHTHTQKESTRGTRLSLDFELTDAMRSYAAANAASVDLSHEHQSFIEYWAAKPGAQGVKLNWVLTWQTWMRNTHKRNVDRGWVQTALVQKTVDDERAERNVKMAAWLAARGTTVEEYNRRKDESGWLDSLKEAPQ